MGGEKMITKKRKLSERKLMALSCGSYLLGIVCMTILGYFYNKIPYRNLLYISCMLHIMYPIFLIEWKEVSKKDIKEMTMKKE